MEGHLCCLCSPCFSGAVNVAVYIAVADVLDAAVGAPVFMQVCMASLLLMASYAVGYPLRICRHPFSWVLKFCISWLIIEQLAEKTLDPLLLS
jgi:hypothetical protein